MPIDINGLNYIIAIVNKINQSNKVTSTNPLTSERDIIVVIINLAKYPDIIFFSQPVTELNCI